MANLKNSRDPMLPAFSNLLVNFFKNLNFASIKSAKFVEFKYRYLVGSFWEGEISDKGVQVNSHS